MIVENNQIYQDNIPAGFEAKDFQDFIRQKHLNEILSKIYNLKKLEYQLERNNTELLLIKNLLTKEMQI
jgi:hypothetical protein